MPVSHKPCERRDHGHRLRRPVRSARNTVSLAVQPRRPTVGRRVLTTISCCNGGSILGYMLYTDKKQQTDSVRGWSRFLISYSLGSVVGQATRSSSFRLTQPNLTYRNSRASSPLCPGVPIVDRRVKQR